MPTAIRGPRRRRPTGGSFKRYVREPHREVLALRGARDAGPPFASSRGATRRTEGGSNEAAVAFLARHGDNGVVWNVLSFWRATK